MQAVDPCPAVLDRQKIIQFGLEHGDHMLVFPFPVVCGHNKGHDGEHGTADGWKWSDEWAVKPECPTLGREMTDDQ